MADKKQDLFIVKLRQGLAALAIDVNDTGIDRLYRYFLELKKWSTRVNLIAKGSTDDQIIENHFLDSLTLLPLLLEKNVHLLDIGTGAGFPGLVLKAAFPKMTITLVEPRLKRVSFLRHVARTLELTNVTVQACRVEDENVLPGDAPYTHITSRAVTDIAGFLDMTARFNNPGLEVICMKGPKWSEELDGARAVLEKLHYVRTATFSHELPVSRAERTLLVFSREKYSEGAG
ncbi:16S rRNA (guanine(527)-N(7))-methyltransferase RsmG [Desulfopila aestuarii]|uniref:Ribosomal RNA small subunit methyltransferase G n=1 Tax=Desulfopila aestuarii DSM 18488 TaxID=1121416 RepID=A0A1M7Y827_9BACT|nr:16S rRNA (guanine(527)-N(7))-methyltransferase RsmG [Desulfopila aestuarii]SHO48782.1 16S rRNA m(7)G-527 methyltransferase [Desulfopila aestuarii DSM 18488]